MQRVSCDERDDWRDTAAKVGFDFHTIGGQPYWDETAYYAFALDEIEGGVETPTGELDAMCRELVSRAVDDERMLRLLRIPERFWTYIAASWKRGDVSLYGRFDLVYDGQAPAKLLEYNADTPTSLFETAVFQWMWLEQAIERQIIPREADQYNSLHESLIAGWKSTPGAERVHLAGVTANPEDAGTLAYLADTAHQAGLSATVLSMDAIGRRSDGVFVDLDDRSIELAFKLYPWEWMMREAFGAALPGASTRWVEPPWKAILSNKGILPLLWTMFPNHPNLLPAYFEDDPQSAALGNSYARKPLYSREGANIELVVDGRAVDADSGPYGAEGHIRQALAQLPQFSSNYAVVGSWFAGGKPCGVGIRESAGPITTNASRFLPHAILN
jgi:glutathionylspermidine synthase